MSTTLDGTLTVAQIVFVNMVLSGDNALVIALTARQFPPPQRRRAIVWGSALAVALQIAFALIVSRLLEVPGLRLAGAIALVLIARKLLFGHSPDVAEVRQPVRQALGAILAILAANIAMSFDNVLAVGALSRGECWLTVLGIFVSAVMLLLVSSLVIRIVQKYPGVIWAGAAVLACTSAELLCDEPLLAGLNDVMPAQFDTDAPAETLPANDLCGRECALAHSTQAGLASVSQAFADESSAGRNWKLYSLTLSLCFAHPQLARTMLRRGDTRSVMSDVGAECS